MKTKLHHLSQTICGFPLLLLPLFALPVNFLPPREAVCLAAVAVVRLCAVPAVLSAAASFLCTLIELLYGGGCNGGGCNGCGGCGCGGCGDCGSGGGGGPQS